MMIIVVLATLGLCMGSFVNALVWRVHQQARGRTSKGKGSKAATPDVGYSTSDRLSILRGRSMCPYCRHELAVRDLIPVFSWLSLRGRCRYCREPVSAQYPLIELVTAGLFVASYLWWPVEVAGWRAVLFGLWLPILTGLIALLVYDLKWLLLPNRIMLSVSYLAALYAIVVIAAADRPLTAFLNLIAAVAVGGGIFYVLFQVSAGKWIGGGDVKLGWLLGLIVGTPGRSLLVIFLAALMGSAVSLPLLASHRLKKTSVVPFGPFLIAAAIVTMLFGQSLLDWYQRSFFSYL